MSSEAARATDEYKAVEVMADKVQDVRNAGTAGEYIRRVPASLDYQRDWQMVAALDSLIAEGWRKKPSRDEVARAIAWGVDGVDGEQFDEAAVDYRLEMLQGADAVLALMDDEWVGQ